MLDFCRSIIVILVLLIFTASQVIAGFVLEQERYEKGTSKKLKGTIYMQENKVKFFDEEGQFSAIFNLETGEMMQIDNMSRTYTSAKAKDYFKFFKEYALKMKTAMQQQLAELTPDQRAQAEEMMKRQGIELPGSNSVPVKIELKKTGDISKIAGYESVKYEIYRNGKLDEEIWTSKEVGLENEIDMNKMTEYMSELRKIEESLGGASSVSKEAEQVYIEVFGSGFPMKTTDYPVSGTSIVEEIVKVSRKQIESSEFRAPAGYRKVPLEQMLQLGSVE
ncbi:MAG: DUF4412 domain-containing protein [Candidatus Dadabacteria bacterium]|jgi:hypothetical protein|nr:DUF4412 domain-containing protein [Candidatus Dadabacteria bacterium]MCZ6528402.1 DUF4412 domain-containing protein [Candidatus Dadabacteria bacterium]MCZ6638716.1 DUF4412 domain-containing protein [Candidatus Dadabacteria bacterium]MCZ6685286.1 DUF4412 domain-containing protein [Candidatus Dadabacteria bacterium]MCZ6791133.1 DUF4412 domain-containing protein [Candidatus Dadabacteria bacterium]